MYSMWSYIHNYAGYLAANAYRDRIAGEKRENVEAAIHTESAYPAEWAATQNGLANAYRDRIAGEKRENVEASIQHLNAALRVYTESACCVAFFLYLCQTPTLTRGNSNRKVLFLRHPSKPNKKGEQTRSSLPVRLFCSP